MLRAFNMGVGLIVVCAAADADRVLSSLREHGEPAAFRIGSVDPRRPMVECIMVG